MATDAQIDDLVSRGADDWVHMAEVAWVARSAGGATTDDEIRVVSLDLIREVLVAGLMEAGDLTRQGFFAWGLAPTEALNRIERSWELLDRDPAPGDVCWLENTEAGNHRAASSHEVPG